VLYLFMTSLEDPSKVIYAPGGHFLSALGYERLGDTVCNAFSNGFVLRANGEVLIYYGGSDTRTYVVRSTLERILDYAMNTPPDALTSPACVQQRIGLIEKNEAIIRNNPQLSRLL
jgi:4-O-beta-D-mannosyl-D-glucose phosphorylase